MEPIVRSSMVRPAARSARVTLRQLCGLGLPPAMALPSLLAALRNIVPATHGAFFFCDKVGNIVNMYAERMLSPEAMARYHEHHFRGDSGAFAGEFLGRVAAVSQVSSRTVTPAERLTGYYQDVLARLGVEHMLYGIVRDGQRVVGQLSLYRDAQGGRFSRDDETALQDVLHYLARALTVPVTPATVSSAARVAEEAVAVLQADGAIRFADGNWLRLVRMARGEPIAPGKAHAEGTAIAEFTAALLAAARKQTSAAHVVESAWGSFAFRHFDMESPDGAHACALVVSRLAVDAVSLAEGAARLGLTPQQREVALLLMQGASNADIANRLGVSIHTATYHVKRLSARLGVHERQQVAQVLRAAAADPGAEAGTQPAAALASGPRASRSR